MHSTVRQQITDQNFLYATIIKLMDLVVTIKVDFLEFSDILYDPIKDNLWSFFYIYIYIYL